jgi:hypothetical protein
MSITIKENPIKDIQWKHAITDNTFDNEFSNKIDKAFTDWSLNHNTWKNKNHVSYSSIMFFPDTSRWSGIVNSIWNQTDNSPAYNRNARDYLVVLELSVMKQNSSYHYHIDAARKQFTGVCYWRRGKDGTILKSGDKELEVGFKHNRCLWFSNVHEHLWATDNKNKENPIMPWHNYRNTSNEPRYTVNINYTPQKFIKSFLKAKDKQFKYWLDHDKPLWLPLIQESDSFQS